MRKTLKACVFIALAINVASVAQAQFVAGPVESVSSDGHSVVVLGQAYELTPETRMLINGKSIRADRLVRSFELGTFAAIEGVTGRPGNSAKTVAIGSHQYVAGASMVFLAGSIEAISPATAELRVGRVTVSLANAFVQIESLQIGDLIQVVGTQPLPFGTVLAQDFRSLRNAAVRSIGGTGTIQSIGGTGTIQSIGGTGTIQSIGGTGTIQSIGGTGTIQSISGTKARSIGGTGASKLLVN